MYFLKSNSAKCKGMRIIRKLAFHFVWRNCLVVECLLRTLLEGSVQALGIQRDTVPRTPGSLGRRTLKGEDKSSGLFGIGSSATEVFRLLATRKPDFIPNDLIS
jgi:hypothetical protein